MRITLQELVRDIESGEADSELKAIQTAIDTRNIKRREAVLDMVHEVWGENATVSVTRG